MTHIKKLSILSIALIVMLAIIVGAVTAQTVTNITNTSAEITWRSLNESDSTVKYGTNASQLYNETTNLNQTLNHTIILTNLTANTKYFYRALSNITTEDDTILHYASSIENFTTLEEEQQEVVLDFINGSLDEVTNNSIIVSWNTTLPSDSLVKYGTETNNYTNSVYNINQTTYHVIKLTNLSANTKYYGVTNSTNANATIESDEFNVTTNETELPPPAEPPLYGVNLTVDSPAKNTTTNVSVTYTININNTGTANDTYNITVDNPQNAQFAIASNVTLNSSENRNMPLSITSNVSGVFNISVTATSTNDSTKNATISTATSVVEPAPPPTPPRENSISGHVINDTNVNRVADVNESGLAGWTIKLIGIAEEKTGVVKDETETDSSGFYKFGNLTAGRYILVLKHERKYITTGAPVLHVNLETGGISQNNDFTAVNIDNFIEAKKGR